MKKRITETSLLDGFVYATTWLYIVSVVNDEIIYWEYRKNEGRLNTACTPSEADLLVVTYNDYDGYKELPLCKKNRSRKVLAEIEEAMNGTA